MRVLDRYIIKSVLGSAMLVLAVLLTLLALFLFFDEQGWVGVGTYGNLQALRFVAMNLPGTLVQFLPVAALIGALRALGALARGSEITVMRASGIPVWRLAVSVLLAGVLLVPVAVGVGEYLAPPLALAARIDKAMQRNADASTNISITGKGSVWISDGTRMLRAEPRQGVAGSGRITLFEIDSGNQLVEVGRAEGAHATPAGTWQLDGYVQSRFAPHRVSAATAEIQPLAISVSPAFLKAIASDPKELSLRELSSAITHLAANRQDTRAYRFAFWSKLAGLFAIPVAVLLAVPFALGSARRGSGTRAVVGLAFGLSYFLLQRTVESGAIVFGMDALVLAFAPLALLAAVVTALLWRLRGAISAA